ncbi:MAG: hypothetical protein ACFFCL_09000, partial [Promethearchaeota archaeon]
KDKELEDKIVLLRLRGELDFEIKVPLHIKQNSLQIPSMLIQPYVENAVKHGLFHKLQTIFKFISVQLVSSF